MLLFLALGCEGKGTEVPQEPRPVVAGVEVVPPEVTLFSIGEEVELFAVVRDEEGKSIDIPLHWRSADNQVVGVSESGVVTARKPGQAFVRVAVPGTGHEAYALVRVRPEPRGLRFAQQPGDLEAGKTFDPPVEVVLVDANGFPVAEAEEEIRVELMAAESALQGETTTVARNGSARFDGLGATKAGEGFRLLALSERYGEVESEAFEVSPGSAIRLGALLPQVELAIWEELFVDLEVKDEFGNLVPLSGVEVTVSPGAESGPLLEPMMRKTEGGEVRVGPLRLDAGLFKSLPGGCHSGKPFSLVFSAEGLESAEVEVLWRDPVRSFTVTSDSDTGGLAFYCTINTQGKAVGCFGFPSVKEAVVEIAIAGHVNEGTICAMGAKGGVFCRGLRLWGHQPAELEVVQGQRVIDLSAGYGHFCALTESGEAACWGKGEKGQLGDGAFTSSEMPLPLSGFQFQKVSAGGEHSCGVTVDGAVFCWGAGEGGKLGVGHENDEGAPTVVMFPEGEKAKAVSAGGNSSCALMESGSVFCWGELFQTGNWEAPTPTLSPRSVPLPEGMKVDEVQVGKHTACLRSGGDAYCWGWSASLGSGVIRHAEGPTEKVLLPPGMKVSRLRLSPWFKYGYALMEGGTPYSWGMDAKEWSCP